MREREVEREGEKGRDGGEGEKEGERVRGGGARHQVVCVRRPSAARVDFLLLPEASRCSISIAVKLR